MNRSLQIIGSSSSWRDFESQLDKFGNNPNRRKEKGEAFENLTRLFLLTDPLYSTKIKNVWLSSDIPSRVIDELGLPHPEIGVDLIAEAKDGTYWAIQCKFHQDTEANVSYQELATFFSVTERESTVSKLSHRLIVTSAQGISRRVASTHPEKLGYLTYDSFNKLGPEQFEGFKELLEHGQYSPEPRSPRPHQKKAIQKCIDYFSDSDQASGKLIHPCGSGKTLTSYWFSEALKAKTILVAVPSLALVSQALRDWTQEAVANNVDMEWIAVCSDEKVSRSDEPSMTKHDLGIEVDTDPEVIISFLKKQSLATKVVITTYQSSLVLCEAAKAAGTIFDFGIYDEAHRTVGYRGRRFSHLLYNENVRVKKRLFMTATERQFRGNSENVISMDDEKIYGTIIDELSFKQAIEMDPPILSDYKIASVVITNSEIQRIIGENNSMTATGQFWSLESDSNTFASLIALRKLLEEKKLKHIVSFHNTIQRAKDFKDLNINASLLDLNLKNLSCFHVSSADNSGERAAVMERFVETEPSLITNARCLSEGVDIPAIDAVLFSDPKQSTIDIVQAVGRALRIYPEKSFGYIILPIVINDGLENQSYDAFDQIIRIISAMGFSDDRIIEEFQILASASPTQVLETPIVEWYLPEQAEIKFEDLVSNIQIRTWTRLSFAKSNNWETEFVKWMRINTTLSEKSIKNYSGAARKIFNDLVRLGMIPSIQENFSDELTAKELKGKYFSIEEYQELDQRGKGMYSAAFNKIIDFLNSKTVNKPNYQQI